MDDESMNILDLLQQRAAAAADKQFLFAEPDCRVFTYAEFQSAINRAAAMLSSHGIGKGDVVSLLMPNSAEYLIGYFACWKLGAIAGPVNSLLKEHEIEFVMNNSQAKAILVAAEFWKRIENISEQLPHLRVVIAFDDEAEATEDFVGSIPDVASTTTDDDAIVIYTSGTTGKPKGCLLTHGNIIANARQ